MEAEIEKNRKIPLNSYLNTERIRGVFLKAEKIILWCFVVFNAIFGVSFPSIPIINQYFKINYVFAILFILINLKNFCKNKIIIFSFIIWATYSIVVIKNVPTLFYGILLIFLIFVSQKRILLSPKIHWFIICISGLSILLQLSTFRLANIPSMYDFNYNLSAMHVFLWIILLGSFLKFKYQVIVSFLGILMKSRSYILSFGVLVISRLIIPNIKIKLKPIYFWIFSLIITIFIGELFVRFVSDKDVKGSRANNVKDMTRLIDESNLHRFKANRVVFESLKDSNNLLTGFGSQNEVVKFYKDKNIKSVTHNSNLKIISFYGLFSIIYFYYLIKIFNNFSVDRMSEVLSWIVYGCFLMRPFEPQVLAFFVAVCIITRRTE